MKTWSYVIESDTRATIRDARGKYKSIKIKNVYKIIENSEEIKGYKSEFANLLLFLLLSISFISILFLLAAFIFGNDFVFMDFSLSVYFSIVLAISSVFLTIISINQVQEMINNHIKFRKRQTCLIVYIIITFMSLTFAYIFYLFGISSKISNTISLVCLYMTVIIDFCNTRRVHGL